MTHKIILSQVVALFQTKTFLQMGSNKFPFVIDSPRGNEASLASSKDILQLIFKIDYVPQIILATIDFLKFKNSINYDGTMNIVTLDQPHKLLNEDCYKEHAEEIEALYDLLLSFKKEGI